MGSYFDRRAGRSQLGVRCRGDQRHNDSRYPQWSRLPSLWAKCCSNAIPNGGADRWRATSLPRRCTLRISNAVSRASVDDTSGKGAVLAGPRWRPAPSPSLRLEIAPRTLAGPGVRIEVVLISACPSVADTKVIGAPLSIA
jgi:hypothetical protein